MTKPYCNTQNLESLIARRKEIDKLIDNEIAELEIKRSSQSAKDMADMYDRGLTLQQIANIFGCSHQSVRQHIRYKSRSDLALEVSRLKKEISILKDNNNHTGSPTV